MEYIVACSTPELLETLCAFVAHLESLPDLRDPRGHHALCVLLGTLHVALAGDADSMAAVVAFTHNHRAWFRLWLPLGKAAPSRDTCLRLVRRLDPETALRLPWPQSTTRDPYSPFLQEAFVDFGPKPQAAMGTLC